MSPLPGRRAATGSAAHGTAARPRRSPSPAALAECLRCLGGLPLVALAQLAAYVFQLVGRCFLGLPDLDPEAFKVGAWASVVLN